MKIPGVLLWCSGLRIWRCHCSGLGSGSLLWFGFSPWPGNFCMCQVRQKEGSWSLIQCLKFSPSFFSITDIIFITSECRCQYYTIFFLFFNCIVECFAGFSPADFFFFFWPHPRHVEVPRPGIETELQLWQSLTCLTTAGTHVNDFKCKSRPSSLRITQTKTTISSSLVR